MGNDVEQHEEEMTQAAPEYKEVPDFMVAKYVGPGVWSLPDINKETSRIDQST